MDSTTTYPTAKLTTTDEFLELIPQAPVTIDELIRQRAAEKGGNDAIVAYPSSGTHYEYYTPRDVSSPLLNDTCSLNDSF